MWALDGPDREPWPLSQESPGRRSRSVRNEAIVAVLTVAYIILIATVAILAQRPPGARPADAPAAEFSSARARRQLESIARRPHPMGSPENEAVGDEIIRQLERLGLRAEVQAISSGDPHGRNLLARLRGAGPAGRPALLLMAHYDTVPSSPGASDDGAGVVTLLETLRALRAGPPLQRDVIVLFTDGEERGLIGARAFLADHPWAPEVGLALNFDARGNAGPSHMFETSEGNGWLIREFARAAPHPFATSLSVTVYKRMPNSTDLTVFLKAGMAGLNFGYYEGLPYYHSPDDSVGNLDERSLQHHGSYALALARHFGNLDLGDHREPDAVFFSTIGPLFVVYPGTWVIPLMVLIALMFFALTVAGLRNGRLSLSGMADGATLLLILLVVVPLTAEVAWLLLRWAWPGAVAAGHGGLFALGFVLLAVAMTLAWYAPAWGEVAVVDLSLGALAWWLALTIASSLWVPGGSYLFLWPLLFSLLGTSAAILARRPDSGLAWAFPYAGAIPALVLFPITASAMYAALAKPAILAGMIVLLAGAIVPLLARVAGRGRSPAVAERV
jgi:hypothetical protein